MTQATDNPSGSRVSPYWRSLDELQSTDAFQEFLAREFPQAASEFPEGVSRRRWMQLMSASFALAGAAGCRWETEQIAPFASRPEGYIPGTHQHYATNVSWAGATRHLLVTKYDERPIKVDGNPEHPASLGASDAFTQAMTLALYDPDRASSVKRRDGSKPFTKTWKEFEDYLLERVESLGDGAGLAILTQPTESHTFNAALERVKDELPAAKFYQHAPLSRENALAGAELAFGQRVRPHYHIAETVDGETTLKAKVIVAVDCDLLGGEPDSLRLAREYGDTRDPDHTMNRLWAVESFFTPTGAAADHRLPVKSSEIGAFLTKLRDKLQAGHGEHGQPVEGEPTPDEFLEALADDLMHHQGEAFLAVGPGQTPEVHQLAWEINSLVGALGETVTFTAEPQPPVEVGSIDELIAAAGDIDTLLVLGGNPAYDAPGFAEAIADVPNTVRLGCYDDETSRVCEWSLPQTHPLEEWGDAIAWDGSIGVCQPMIEPLLGGRSVVELLALVTGDRAPNPRQMAFDAVSQAADLTDEKAWNKLLHDGLLEGSAADPVGVSYSGESVSLEGGSGDLEVVFTPSSSTYDGCLANSGWLQEAPDFLTKLTWDNAALVSPVTAGELGLVHGKMATLTVGESSLDVPVYVMPGQAAGSIAIALGYGRTAAGRVGGLVDPDTGKSEGGIYANDLAALWLPAPADPVGVDAYPLRPSAATGFVAGGVSLENTGKDYLLATTQDHHAIDQMGMEAIGRRTGELIRTGTKDLYDEHPDFAPHMSHDVMIHAGGEHRPTEPLWDVPKHRDGDYAWGMTVDLSKCLGCNACVVACQADNNVPVVGKDQVAKGREMHWIRIDRYFKGVANADNAGDPANFVNPEVAHQPIACMHCETAPCEEVCPVAATVHDDEGLNGMTYNRCIGTRYCANNCPYKVRRFNYFRYTKPLYEDANKLLQLSVNPEVTVRSRGVMEKCTFCVQRISAARITAKNEGRKIRDGEVVTACQQVCSTGAIEFGNLLDDDSRVSKAQASPRAYGLLTELMTRPRTLYLARITNPHWMLPKRDPEVHHGGHHEEGHEGEHHDEGHGDDHHDDKSPAEEATHA